MVKTNINIADTQLNSKLVKNFLKSEELNGFYSFKNDIKTNITKKHESNKHSYFAKPNERDITQKI